MPRISESTGTFSEVAGSSGGMTELSQRPTMTRFSGSQSFHELTILVMYCSFPGSRRCHISRTPTYAPRTTKNREPAKNAETAPWQSTRVL